MAEDELIGGCELSRKEASTLTEMKQLLHLLFKAASTPDKAAARLAFLFAEPVAANKTGIVQHGMQSFLLAPVVSKGPGGGL